MYKPICDFTALVTQELKHIVLDKYDAQMDRPDNYYVFFVSARYGNCDVWPAKTALAQALLQYCAKLGCPYSLLRLGCSLANRNPQRGQILSDDMACHTLLTAFQDIQNGLYVPNVKPAFEAMKETEEFHLGKDLLLGLILQKPQSLCPELMSLLGLSKAMQAPTLLQ